MSEVPPDVLHTAQKLCDDLIQAWLLHHSRDEACTFAVKALMEERQRCADVVKFAKSNTGIYVNKIAVAEAIVKGGISRLNAPRGPDTETDDSKLTGTRCQMAIEHTDGSERFDRPETRREGTEA